MAQTNLKESLQCFAFAYFAENPVKPGKTNKVTHVEGWYNIFDSSVDLNGRDLRSKYGSYLSSTFGPDTFESIVKKYRSSVTKTGKTSINGAVKKVYLVVKKVVDSNFFTSGLNQYEFLDQSDPFTVLVKDDCLTRIAYKLGMSGKADLLSPVDLFVLRKSKRTEIFEEFFSNILEATKNQILSNLSWGKTGKNTYRTISNKYFKTKDLVGISLKLPETIKGAGVLKIVGTENVDPHLLDFIDPYTKLIAAMLAHPSKTKDLIEKVIDIEFHNFRITPSILSWEYPITFRYKDVTDPRFLGPATEPFYKNNLRFKLFTWSKAGFNGQWYKGQGAPGNWAGGAGIESLGELFIKYNEYPGILNELVQIRKESFYYAIHKSTADPFTTIPSNLKSDYNKALDAIEQQSILTSSKQSSAKHILQFFQKFDKTNKKYYQYQKEVIKSTTKNMRNASNTTTNDKKRLEAHYVACQCAWFLFRGGPNLHKYLKQRMFLSLFGLITKSGYKIFQGNEETIMEDYIKTKFKKNKRKVVAYFNAAPHIVLS
jgi:hypothetical protein